MRIPLKQAVKFHFSGRSLSPEKLRKLDPYRIRSGMTAGLAIFRNRKTRSILIAVAASLILVLPFGLFELHQKRLQDQIVEDMVYNHFKQLKPEIITSSLESLQNYFSGLEFQLVQSSFLPPGEWKVLGGRCVYVQGQLSVLMRVQHKGTGTICSFYQVPVPKGFSAATDVEERYLKGVKVKIWCEKGLLMALLGGEIATI